MLLLPVLLSCSRIAVVGTFGIVDTVENMLPQNKKQDNKVNKATYYLHVTCLRFFGHPFVPGLGVRMTSLPRSWSPELSLAEFSSHR